MQERFGLFITSLIVLGLACGPLGGRAQPSSSPEIASSTPSPTVELVSTAPAASEVSQPEELPPMTYEEFLQTGVEEGRWTEGEGLAMILRYILGDLGTEDIPGVDDVAFRSGSGAAAQAYEYLARPDHDPELGADIERSLRILLPSQELLDSLSAPASDFSAARSGKLAAANDVFLAQSQDVCLQSLVEGGDPPAIVCFLFIDRSVATGSTVRVYYPVGVEAQHSVETAAVGLADVMESTAELYDSLGLRTRDYYTLFWPGIPESFGVLSNYDFSELPNLCKLSIVFGSLPGNYPQRIAFEMADCALDVVGGNMPTSIRGAALYFSNVAWPEDDLERSVLPYFDQESVDKSVLSMGPESFVFYQYMGNVYGSQAVVDIMEDLHSGSMDWAAYIEPGLPGDFSHMTVRFLSSGIADQDTGTSFQGKSPAYVTDRIDVDEVGDFEIKATRGVLRRYSIVYGKERRFLQEASNPEELSAVETKMQRQFDSWSGLAPEIRSSCKDDVSYLYVPPDNGTGPIRVTRVERALCDPCLLGAWQVDTDTFAEYMQAVFDNEVPAVMNMLLRIEGDYYLQFDTEGKITTQRHNMVVNFGMVGVEGLSPSLDPDAPGPQPTLEFGALTGGVIINSSGLGMYSADGEELGVYQYVDVPADIGVNVGPDGNPAVVYGVSGDWIGANVAIAKSYDPQFAEEQGPEDESVEYMCKGNLLDITTPKYGTTLHLDRVDRILPTPIPTPALIGE